MIPVLSEAAFHSLFVGLTGAIGLRVFRIRNAFVRQAASARAPIGDVDGAFTNAHHRALASYPRQHEHSAPLHPMTLLEELQARIQAKSGSGNIRRSFAAPPPADNQAKTEEPPGPPHDSTLTPGPKEPGPSTLNPLFRSQSRPSTTMSRQTK
jgi:hypothetical protein